MVKASGAICLYGTIFPFQNVKFRGVLDHRDGNGGFIRRPFLILAVRVTNHIELSEQNRGEILAVKFACW